MATGSIGLGNPTGPKP